MSFLISLVHSLLWSAVFLGAVPLFIVNHTGYRISFFSLGLGILLAVAGFGLFLKAVSDLSRRGGTTTILKKADRLVREGVYRFTRNPVYLSVILISLGEAVALQSFLLLLYTSALFLGLHGWLLFYEEPLLRKVYGSEFERYRRQVPRWVAFPHIWTCWGRQRRNRFSRLSP